MGTKGEQTKQFSIDKSYDLFAEKDFKAVTMKDICEVTRLSRGGLYRYYDSTATIFEDIFKTIADSSIEDIDMKIESQEPAREILEAFLLQLKDEMLDASHSLSLAIYEYAHDVDATFFDKLNEIGRKKWHKLLQYGIDTKAFNEVDIDQVIDVMVYAYQGIRMWSRGIPIGEDTACHIIKTVKDLLLIQ